MVRLRVSGKRGIGGLYWGEASGYNGVDTGWKGPSMRTRGFTLIELLVVIAIIGLLLAIMIPALQKGKDYAQRLVCATHLRGFGLANTLYVEANKGWFVPVMDWRDPARMGYWPSNDLFRELLGLKEAQGQRETWHSPKKFLCPSDRISKQEVKDIQWDSYLSYAGNITDWYASAGWANIKYAGHKESMLPSPGTKMAFGESNDWWMWWPGADYRKGWDVLGQDTITPYKGKGCDGPTLYRHSEGANVTFYDGHVENMKKEKIFVTEDWDATPKRPGMWTAYSGYPPDASKLVSP